MGFSSKCLKKHNIRYWLIFTQINRNIFFQVISLLTNFSWVTVWKKYHFNIFNINNIREGGKLRKNGGVHSTLDISIVNIVMEFWFFVCVRLDLLVHTDIVCKDFFIFILKKKKKCKNRHNSPYFEIFLILMAIVLYMYFK